MGLRRIFQILKDIGKKSGLDGSSEKYKKIQRWWYTEWNGLYGHDQLSPSTKKKKKMIIMIVL